ncbi:MAG TPA: glycosyltransferase family 87 protein [Leptolyngbyaceae cyanobacterium]
MLVYLIYAVLILLTVGLNTKILSSKKQDTNLWITYGLPALVMAIFSFAVSYSNFCGDFNKSYYPAGRLILENPANLYEWGRGLGFVNIPIFALFFIPISFLNKLAAQIIFTLLGLLAIWWSGHLLVKLTKAAGWQKLAIWGLILINGPLHYSLKQGNSTHFVLLLLISAVFCMRDKREIWVGVLLAIAALIKIPLFLLAGYFTLRGRWRVLMGFVGALFAIVGTSILVFGLDLHIVWYQKCILAFTGKSIAAFNVQSVDGFLARLFGDAELKNWELLQMGVNFKVIRYLLFSLLFGSTLFVLWRSKQPNNYPIENLEFCIFICLGVVVSPISWTHYYLYLLLPIVLYLTNQIPIFSGQIWSKLVLISAGLVSLPVILIKIDNPLVKLLYSKILISHYFFGGILLMSVLLVARWQAAKPDRITLME